MMEDNNYEKDLAIEIINRKINKIVSDAKKFADLKNELKELKEEKEKVYQGDRDIINKAITVYIEDVKLDGGE